MKIALSPCPNDTHLFYAWIQGIVGQEFKPEPIFADIEQLNELALQRTLPLIKLSFPCFAQVLDHYQLLPIGSALGLNCGPKLIAREFNQDLTTQTVAIPGKHTMAHALLNKLLPPPKKKHFCLYHEVYKLLETRQVDCGLIIHESRFTYKQAGFVEIADLGELWHQKTNALLPLGGLAIAKNLPEKTKLQILKILQSSLAYAHQNPSQAHPFILEHSQEQKSSIVQKHIDTYVTDETAQLSSKGIEAINHFLDCSESNDWLFSPTNV